VEDLPETYFQLGVAYRQAYRFAEAEKAFRKVLWIHGSLVAEAKEELDSMRDIPRTGPGSLAIPE
jgi:hypothetical protein